MSITSLVRQYTSDLTLTNDNMYPGLIDQVHREVPYLYWMANRSRGSGGIMFENGGTMLKFSIVNAKSQLSKAYYGTDTIPVSQEEGITAGFEVWRSNAQPILITYDEIMENSGDEGVMKIAPAKYQVALMSLYNDVHRQLVQGVVGTTGTGTANRRFQAADKELLPLGFLIQKEFGNADLVHSINQATDTYWQNTLPSVGASTAVTLAEFRREMRNVTHRASFGSTNDAPDLGLCTQEYYELVEASVDDRRRYVDEVDADVSFEHVKLGQTTYIMDYQVPDFGDTASDTVSLTTAAARAACIGINTNWMQLVVHPSAYFTPTPWLDAQLQTMIVSKILLKASHRCTQRRKQYLHYGVNGAITI